MTIEQLNQRVKGLRLQHKLRSVWNDLYDDGIRSGVTKTTIDNSELWYFREAVRRGDFNFFLSRIDGDIDHEAFDRYLDASSELWEDDCSCQ